jgi:N-acetylmuramoyl-L-alanine amidase
MTESVSRDSDEIDVIVGTLYAEARGEPVEGQEWVIWVIKNRARLNRSYWGGNQMKNVCLHRYQFECWNWHSSITMPECSYTSLKTFVGKILAEQEDPTGGCDHYNNPDKEGYPDWTKNCKRVRKIANHQFYKSNN